MFRLDAVLTWGTLLDIMPTSSHYSSHCIFLCKFMLLMLYFLVFTAILMGWVEIRDLYSIWLLYM